MTCDAWPYCEIGGWGESGLKLILIYFSMAKGKGETVFPSKLGNDLSTNLSGHAFLGEIEKKTSGREYNLKRARRSRAINDHHIQHAKFEMFVKK